MDKWEDTPGREHCRSANMYSSGTSYAEVSKRNPCEECQFGGRNAQVNMNHVLRAVKGEDQRSITEFIAGNVSSEL